MSFFRISCTTRTPSRTIGYWQLAIATDSRLTNRRSHMPHIFLALLFVAHGDGTKSSERKAGTTRLWIDKKTFLPIKRETTLDLGDEEKPVRIRAKETYTNWILN